MLRDHWRGKTAIWVLTALNVISVHAGELAFGIGYEGQYSDNVLKTATDPKEEWTNIYLASMGYRELSTDLAADIQAQVLYRGYTKGLYEDETLGYLSSAALWSISPQRLVWSIVDRLDQLPQNSTTPISSPFDHDAVNVFETGPDLLFPVTPVSTLVVGARYRNVWLKLGNNDNTGAIAVLRLRHRFASSTVVSINAEGGQVEYTETPISPSDVLTNYRRADYYFRYDQRLVSSRILFDAGATRIVPETEREDVTEPIFRLNLAHKLSTDSTIGISYGRELMSIGTALLAGVGDPSIKETITSPASIPYELASGGIYKSRRGDAFFTIAGTVLRAQTSILYRDLDYLDVPEDRTETGAYQSVTQRLTATLELGIWGGTKKTEYPVGSSYPNGRLDRDVSYGVSLTYWLSPRLSFGIEGVHEQRVSSETIVNADYEENRGIIRFVYSGSPQLQMSMIRGTGHVP